MPGAQNFPALIRELHAELRQHGAAARGSERARWRARAFELALLRLSSPRELLDWAKRDRRWSFTLAEVMREAHTGPAELAARLLVAMLERIEDERETSAPEVPAEALHGGAPLYAD